MPAKQIRIYEGLGFSNVHVCGTILVIINTINLPDIHKKNEAIHH